MNDAAANPVTESAPNIGMGAEYPQLLEVTERLNENVAQLHRSVCLFMGQAWNKASSGDFLLLCTERTRRQRMSVALRCEEECSKACSWLFQCSLFRIAVRRNVWQDGCQIR